MKGDERIGFAMKALVVRDRTLLLLKKSDKEEVNPKSWDIPGGRLEFKEEPGESLKREIREEAGLEVELIRPINVWSMIKEEKNFQLVGVNYLCKWVSGEPQISEEHDFAGWTDFENVLSDEKYPDWIKNILKLALGGDNEIKV